MQQLLLDAGATPALNTALYTTSHSPLLPPAFPPQLLLPLYHHPLAPNQLPNRKSELHLSCVQLPKSSFPYLLNVAKHSVNDGHRKTINPSSVHRLNKASSP